MNDEKIFKVDEIQLVYDDIVKLYTRAKEILDEVKTESEADCMKMVGKYRRGYDNNFMKTYDSFTKAIKNSGELIKCINGAAMQMGDVDMKIAVEIQKDIYGVSSQYDEK